MSDEFDLDGDLFMKVRRAVGTEETRYYLWGVHVEPISDGGAMMIASDGRVMMVAKDEKAVAQRSATIRLTLPEDPPAECRDGDECQMQGWDYARSRLRFSLDAEKPAIAQFWHGGNAFQTSIVEETGGNYPNWRKAALSTDTIKPRKGHAAFGINPQQLHCVAGRDLVALQGHGEGRPVHIIFAGEANLFGVIMPCDLTNIGKSQSLLDEVKSSEAAE